MKASNLQPRSPSSTVELSIEGKQHGHLIVPSPSAASAEGAAQIPICIIRNGDGPVISLLAGARGDEYDGRIALQKLINDINIEDVSGCLIIVPNMNPLAAVSHTRTSPTDDKDLDASYPGDSETSVTEQVAAFLYSEVVQPAELIIEFQSGGASTEYTPLAAVHFNPENKELQQLAEQTMIAFGAPYSARLLPSSKGSLAHAASELGKPFIAVRLGGGGSCRASCVSTAVTGCKNALVQLGVLKHDLELRSTRMLEVASENNYVLAPLSGLLEMCKEPGDDVYMGSPIARIIQPGHTGLTATVLNANRNGVLMARHHAGFIEQGQCAAIVADEVQR